jgi:hypothetical protein
MRPRKSDDTNYANSGKDKSMYSGRIDASPKIFSGGANLFDFRATWMAAFHPSEPFAFNGEIDRSRP